MKKDRGKKEVEYKNKSGTAWSHSYLNQKPWHPLSYPNQRRKWIAEQTHSERQRKAEEVGREFAQEQDFFRTSALLSSKEREKMEVMQAVGFMYMRPPGYNAESARAAEIADEKKSITDDSILNSDDAAAAPENKMIDGKRKPRMKDLYGRTVPTEEEFPVLKNAPRLESGASARVKPFGVEIRNVKCARCGAFGHQSGDRECPLKDSITPSEEARQRRDDPLTAIMNAVSDEPLKWELKQQPGSLTPPRGGFKADDPNQQIIPEDIYDEYGGFLAGGSDVQDILALFPQIKHKKTERKKGKKEKAASNSGSEKEHRRKRKRKKERSKSDRETKEDKRLRRDKNSHSRHKKSSTESDSSSS